MHALDKLERLRRGKMLLERYRTSEGREAKAELLLAMPWLRQQVVEAGCFRPVRAVSGRDGHCQEIDPFATFPQTSAGKDVVSQMVEMVSQAIKVAEAKKSNL
jgi:hypothetical protein